MNQKNFSLTVMTDGLLATHDNIKRKDRKTQLVFRGKKASHKTG